MPGVKHDQDKPRLDLIPPEVILAIGEVMTFGANKYGANTWQGVEMARYEAALMAYKMGEEIDPESGFPHLWHVLCNAAFMVAKEGEVGKRLRTQESEDIFAKAIIALSRERLLNRAFEAGVISCDEWLAGMRELQPDIEAGYREVQRLSGKGEEK